MITSDGQIGTLEISWSTGDPASMGDPASIVGNTSFCTNDVMWPFWSVGMTESEVENRPFGGVFRGPHSRV